MTTSGDIAPIETKLMLQQNAIPKFSSYLSKLLKDKKKIKDPSKVTNTKLKVFKKPTKKQITEEMFTNLQKIIRDNKVDIRNVQVIQNPTINESRKAIDYKKEICLYSEEDCKFVYEGFKEYEGVFLDKEKLTITFNFQDPKYNKLIRS
jgi:hypothetical protein